MVTKLPILILAAAGGRRLLVDLPDPPLAPDGRPLLQGQQYDDSGGLRSGMVLLFLVVVAMVITCLFYTICNKAEQETSGHGQRPPTSNNGGGHQGRRRAPRQRQAPAAGAAAVVDNDIESGKAPPRMLLECMYRAAEGWEETTCSVCLAELADGESLRVVIPCRHYFHSACIVEWLRKSATCPLCRAPLPKATHEQRLPY